MATCKTFLSDSKLQSLLIDCICMTHICHCVTVPGVCPAKHNWLDQPDTHVCTTFARH